ncbi:hypothetical protein CAQ69_20795 [Stutzerimonas stutzeri]|nr:hypothetical protein CAQ69_20795 [Stutzerimonas stutzeri]
MADSLAVFLYSSNGRAKRGSQANTSRHQGLAGNQCHQPKLQPCPRQTPRSSQPPWPSGDDQASAAQSGGLAGLAVM